MAQLTNAEINEAERILNEQGTSAMYEYLANKGDTYAELANGVTENNNWQGRLANEYLEEAAKNNNVDMSYGSENWNKLNQDLAQSHIDAYRQSNGNQPGREAIQMP